MREHKNRKLLIGVVGIVGLVATVALAFDRTELANVLIAGGAYSANWRDDNNATGEQGWQANLQASGPMKVDTVHLVFHPGEIVDWHKHSGMAIGEVVSGTFGFYSSTDPNCTQFLYSAGQGFVEIGSHIHYAKNEGPGELDMYFTFIYPPDGPRTIFVPDAEKPQNCLFRGF